MGRSGTRSSGEAIRRLVGERPTAHVDVVGSPGMWRGGDVVALWPNLVLEGIDPRERWIRLSTGRDALFLRAHDWAPAERSRYLAVRLVEDGSGAVRAVEEGCLSLADVVAMLHPPEHPPPFPASRRRGSIAADVAAVALATASLLAASSAATVLALQLALR